MPFISASSSGRAPTTPYPTSAEPEIETPNFKFGEDSTLLATGKKPKAPSGPVASVPIKFTFGEGQTTPLFTKKSVAAAPVKTTTTVPPPPAQPTAVTQKSEEAPAASKPVMNLWSADFLAKNQEHQKKVQAAIEEEEKAASKPPAPSPFAPSAPAGDKPAFSFGIHAASSAPAPSTDASGFTFGSTAPAAPTSAPASAPAFSFGSTAPVKPAETTEVKKPAGESGLLAFWARLRAKLKQQVNLRLRPRSHLARHPSRLIMCP
jgi:nucleoporin NUP1